ncbi:MAG: hypothetical protein H7062_09625 [Candidatus Saccharimonas sp.]|nr:hypothetical protein [Planctomycetaceae bacterium]
MEVLNSLCAWSISAMDYPLGWLLWLPRDVTLLLFAVGTALWMTLVRRAVTNQDLLRRCSEDLRRLKQFTREAGQSRDTPTRQRLRGTVGMIKGMQLTADMRVLVTVLFPVAVLAIWATERLDFLPPRVGHDLIVRARFPRSSIEELTHLVPTAGCEWKTSAIQVIRADAESTTNGLAEWTLRPTSVAEDLAIVIRHRNESATHRVAIGRPTYRPPVQAHAIERLALTEVVLDRYRPLGLNLKTEVIGLPPWMVGYLVLTLLLVPTFKRLLRVY